MAWYPDLSPYEYLGGCAPMLNVGWLERGRDFITGAVPPEFTARLRALADRPANLCRGKHICDLCEPPDDARPVDRESVFRFLDWGNGRDGNGEIHVPSAAGVTYSAPVLIVHYVAAHQYRPPAAFVDAVLGAASET